MKSSLLTIVVIILSYHFCMAQYNTNEEIISKKIYETKHYSRAIYDRDSLYKRGDYQKSINSLKSDTSITPAQLYLIAVNYAKMDKVDSAFFYLNQYVDISSDDRIIVVDKDWNTLRQDTLRWKLLINKIEQYYLQTLDSTLNKKLALELFYLGINDQKYRLFLPSMGQIDSLDLKNGMIEEEKVQEKFIQIVEQYGFPTISMVGILGSQNAFLLLQHSDNIEQYYSQIKKAYQKHDIDPEYYALITDRYLMNKGKKQLYGSQFIRNPKTEKRFPGKMVLWPVKDFKDVNKRREEMGFSTTVEQNAKRGHNWYIPEEYYKNGGEISWVR